MAKRNGKICSPIEQKSVMSEEATVRKKHNKVNHSLKEQKIRDRIYSAESIAPSCDDNNSDSGANYVLNFTRKNEEFEK